MPDLEHDRVERVVGEHQQGRQRVEFEKRQRVVAASRVDALERRRSALHR